ncbi:MAG: hypothetical protein ACK4S8_15280, partial [Alishewanella aestuarii]
MVEFSRGTIKREACPSALERVAFIPEIQAGLLQITGFPSETLVIATSPTAGLMLYAALSNVTGAAAL